jgi:hypothetical protein
MQCKRNHSIILSLLLAFFLSLIPGCDRSKNDSTSLCIPFLVCVSPEGEDEMRVHTGSWNIESGEVLISKKRIMKLTGPSYRSSIGIWNGDSTIYLEPIGVSAGEISKSVDVKRLPHDLSQTVFGNGLVIRLDEGSYRVTTDSGDEFTTGPVFHEFEINGDTFHVGDSSLIGAGIHDSRACFIYKYSDPKDYLNTYLFYGLYDITGNRWNWSGLIPVPEEYASDIVTRSWHRSTYFNGNGLYLSGGRAICFLDVEDEQFVPLIHVSNAVEGLIPGTTHFDELRGFGYPAGISGGLGDIVICNMRLYSEHSDETYSVYYAVRNCEILGIFVWNKNSIICYDSEMQLLKKNVINVKITPVPAPIRFPSYNYR